MRLPKSFIECCTAHTVADDAENRPSLTGVYYDSTTHTFQAVQGIIGVFAPAEHDATYPDESFLMSSETVECIRLYQKQLVKDHEVTFILQGDEIVVMPGNVVKENRFPVMTETFPSRFRDIIPNPDMMQHIVSLDAHLLIRLLQAVCAPDTDLHSVALFIAKEDAHKRPIIIAAHDDARRIGMLMPIHNRMYLVDKFTYSRPEAK